MPLPNAKPDPAGSNVYRQLNSITLGDLTNQQFDKVYQNVFLNDMSEDELRRLALVGAARQSFSASSSGPIPGGQRIIETDISTPNSYVTVFTPDEGEVWQFQGFNSRGGSGLVGTLIYELDLYNPNTTERLLLIDASSSSSSDFPITESGQPYPIYLTYPHVCRVRVEGTFTTSLVSTGFFRVR
jgi:hypothetical protein